MASSRFSYPSESSAAASPSYSSTSARFSYATPSGLGTPTSASSFPISPRSSLPPTSAPRPFAKRASSAAHSPFGPYPGAVASGSAGAAGTPTNASSQAKGANQGGVDVYERPLGKARNSEVALSSLGFLFAEMVAYTQNRVSGITELEKRLSLLGYHIGTRLLPLLTHRLESGSKQPRRETRLLPVLLFVHTHLWRAAFGKPADSLEKSTEKSDEYMISTNTPVFSRSISVPREMNQLSTEAITAGMVEAALDGLGFPARVTAHSVPTDGQPQRTTILIKLDQSVMDREEALNAASS